MSKRNWFGHALTQELARARKLHTRPINSVHEGYAIIQEELDEFWEEVRRRDGCRDTLGMLDELVQIAAMAQRTAEDVVMRMEMEQQRRGK